MLARAARVQMISQARRVNQAKESMSEQAMQALCTADPMGDGKRLVFECRAMQEHCNKRDHLSSSGCDTMQTFMWQHDLIHSWQATNVMMCHSSNRRCRCTYLRGSQRATCM